MRKGIQDFLYEMWEAACYAIDIVKIASLFRKAELDLVASVEAAIEAGYIHFDYDNPDDQDNFFVLEADKMLSALTGVSWTMTKEGPDYVLQPGEWCAERWEYAKVNHTYGHFRLPDWDSLRDSNCVRLGKLVSKRVFRRTA